MKLRLLYFASLREQLGTAQEEIELPAGVETLDTRLPQLDIDDPAAVARFIIQHLGLNRARLVR